MRDIDADFSKSISFGHDVTGLVVRVGPQKFFANSFVFRVNAFPDNRVEMVIEGTGMILTVMTWVGLIDLVKFVEQNAVVLIDLLHSI